MKNISKKNIMQIISAIFVITVTVTSKESLGTGIMPHEPVTKLDGQNWKVIVSPYIWTASLNGHSNIVGHRTNVDVPFSDIFKNIDLSAMGNIEITNERYGVYLDGQYTKTSQGGQLDSQILDADITLSSLSAGAFFRAYETPLYGKTVMGTPRVFAFEPTVGVRWTKLKVGLKLESMSETHRVQWTDPFIGARIQADLSDRWNLFTEADIGGFGAGTDFSAQGQVYLGYHMNIFKQPALLRFGYRALYQDYAEDNALEHKFKWDVTQHGPVVGISLVF